MITGEWTDPQRGKIKLRDYAQTWIAQRPGLRVRTVDFYRWLLARHIEPFLGDIPIGKLSTQAIREWRAGLLAAGVSATMAAKAYRLLRAILTTAVEEDKILSRNPCRIRGAGSERSPERPVLTVAQVFQLADLVGRRPVGNIRQLAQGGYRLRFQLHGVIRTSPEVYATRAEAERELWAMANDGRADCNHDRRYRALVLLATFASLRWGEATALRRCDLDLAAGTVRVRAAFAERSTGEIILGPPKSKAGRRIVGVPRVIVPDLRDHLAVFVKPGADALVFPGAKGGPIRRGNFNRSAAWPHAVAAIGAAGLHFHDLRHTGNHFAAKSGAGLKDLMARMGHDSERAAIIYQHEARGADAAITNAIDAHVEAERRRDDEDDDAPGRGAGTRAG
ncbi:MAG: tyrosine-type recombinase/integrase [Streptosporangiaceae bacterium]